MTEEINKQEEEKDNTHPPTNEIPKGWVPPSGWPGLFDNASDVVTLKTFSSKIRNQIIFNKLIDKINQIEEAKRKAKSDIDIPSPHQIDIPDSWLTEAVLDAAHRYWVKTHPEEQIVSRMP